MEALDIVFSRCSFKIRTAWKCFQEVVTCASGIKTETKSSIPSLAGAAFMVLAGISVSRASAMKLFGTTSAAGGGD